MNVCGQGLCGMTRVHSLINQDKTTRIGNHPLSFLIACLLHAGTSKNGPSLPNAPQPAQAATSTRAAPPLPCLTLSGGLHHPVPTSLGRRSRLTPKPPPGCATPQRCRTPLCHASTLPDTDAPPASLCRGRCRGLTTVIIGEEP
jgi:hypothetical protein